MELFVNEPNYIIIMETLKVFPYLLRSVGILSLPCQLKSYTANPGVLDSVFLGNDLKSLVSVRDCLVLFEVFYFQILSIQLEDALQAPVR